MNESHEYNGLLERLFIKCIRLYQSRPHKPVCRYKPSCSNYAILAIKKYGWVIGTIKGAYRILRCNPWSKGGIDYP